MKRMVTLFTLLAALSCVFLWLDPVEANILPPCWWPSWHGGPSICDRADSSASTHCSCPSGTPLATQDATCGTWQAYCQGEA